MTRSSDGEIRSDRVNRPAPLDELDRRILSVLRDDGRISVPRLAETLHTSRATAYARLGRLRDLGVLRGFSAVVEPKRVGNAVTALVLVTSARPGHRRWMAWRDELTKIPAVEWAAMVAGDTDIALLVRARDQEELRAVLLEQIQSLEFVGATRTLIVLDEVLHRPFIVPED